MILPKGIDPSLNDRINEYLSFYQDFRTDRNLSSREVPSYSKIYHPSIGWIGHSGNQVEEERDPSLHSEILAMKHALQVTNDKHLTDCILFTNLEPCFLCAVSIVKYRVAKVVYFACAASGQGISSFPMEMIYQSYHFPELIFIPLDSMGEDFRFFFKKMR